MTASAVSEQLLTPGVQTQGRHEMVSESQNLSDSAQTVRSSRWPSKEQSTKVSPSQRPVPGMQKISMQLPKAQNWLPLMQSVTRS